MSADGDVDVLLTNDWPQGLCEGLPGSARPEGMKPSDGGWAGAAFVGGVGGVLGSNSRGPLAVGPLQWLPCPPS